MKRIIQFLAPPVFEADEEKTRNAYLLNVIAISSLVGALLYCLFSPAERLPYIVLAIAILLTVWQAMRRGYVRAASIALITGISAVFVISVFTGGGVRAPAYSGFFIIIFLAGLLLGWKAALSVIIFSILYGVVLIQADARGLLPEAFKYSSSAVLIIDSVLLTMTGVIFILALGIINDALRRTHSELAERKQIEFDLRKREAILETAASSAELSI
jgi:hypothetical protein